MDTTETYPVTVSCPPARVNGYRVLAWAEQERLRGNYPGGIVLAVREDRGDGYGPEYVTWVAYTKDGGQTWAACWGHYIRDHADAWADFISRCTLLATS